MSIKDQITNILTKLMGKLNIQKITKNLVMILLKSSNQPNQGAKSNQN